MIVVPLTNGSFLHLESGATITIQPPNTVTVTYLSGQTFTPTPEGSFLLRKLVSSSLQTEISLTQQQAQAAGIQIWAPDRNSDGSYKN